MKVDGLLEKLSALQPAVRAALIAISLVPLYYGSFVYRTAHPWGGTQTSHKAQEDPSSTDFIQDWLDVRYSSPFNPTPIRRYCQNTTWHPNLILRLENANGGIGNVRGNILDFLFQSIEAGAAIIMPNMATRNQEDISNVWASHAPFDHFFDEEWFLSAMEEACPELKIYHPKDGVMPADILPGGNYMPRSRRVDQEVLFTRNEALDNLHKWLKGAEGYDPDSATVINVERTLWDIDTRSLPEGFRRSFGQLLRIKPSVRRLAAIVIQNLAAKHNVSLDPRDFIPSRSFHGAHLRTEADAQNAGWTAVPHGNWSAQTDAYILQAVKHKLSTTYVASGNETDFERYKAKAAAHRPPITITSKFELLPPKEAAALKALAWDQQALVDYEVLHRCSVFGGFVKSSFAFNIAMTRSQWLEDEGRVADPWYVVNKEEDVAFDDGISRVYGRDGWHEMRIPRGMWP